MEHKKVYGIGENKCKVEVIPKENFIVVQNTASGCTDNGKPREMFKTVRNLPPNSEWQVIFAGQDQAYKEKGTTGDYMEGFSGAYKPMVYSELGGMDNDIVLSKITPSSGKLVADSTGTMSVPIRFYVAGTVSDLELEYDMRFRLVLMRIA